MGLFPKIILFGNDDMENIKEELTKINDRFETCDSKHEDHNRRREDMVKDSQKQTRILEDILKTLQEHAPVLKRARDSQTTGDKLKEYFIWVAAMSAGGAGIHYWLKLFLGD